MSLPLTIENGKPMTDVFSMAGPPYTETDEDMTDTVKMVPFVNLGESAPLPEVAEQPVLPELTMTSDKIPKEVIVTTPPPEHPTTTESVSLQEMVKSKSPEVSEKLPSPMTKHTLIQMAVDRLKDMEHKKGNLISNNDDIYNEKSSHYNLCRCDGDHEEPEGG